MGRWWGIRAQPTNVKPDGAKYIALEYGGQYD